MTKQVDYSKSNLISLQDKNVIAKNISERLLKRLQNEETNTKFGIAHNDHFSHLNVTQR